MSQPLDREKLGQIVRQVWIEKARTLDNPKPSNLLPWEELDEWNQEVDRCIGEEVGKAAFRQVVGYLLDKVADNHDSELYMALNWKYCPCCQIRASYVLRVVLVKTMLAYYSECDHHKMLRTRKAVLKAWYRR